MNTQVAVQKNDKRKSFDKFLKEQLSYADYVSLPKHLHKSSHAVTKLKRNPKKGTSADLFILVKLLRKWTPDMTAKLLMKEYSFGSPNLVIVD